MHRNDKIIRFRKRGHSHYPIYEIVIMFRYKRNRADFLERIGFFNPNYKERSLYIDFNRLGFWLNRGASLHDSLKKYISKFIFL